MQKGALKGTGSGPSIPKPTPDKDGYFVTVDKDQPGLLNEENPAPLGGIQLADAGAYVGKRGLDQWRYTINPTRTVVVLGDSTAQGVTGSLDTWPERLARDIGFWTGPRLSSGAGFYGLYRGGNLTTASGNGDREWIPWPINGATADWSVASNANSYYQVPHSSTLIMTNADAVAVATATNGTTTDDSFAISTGSAFFASTDVGRLITGTNIPPNTIINGFTSSTSAQISQRAYGAASATATFNLHGPTLTWTRPISNYASRIMYDATFTTSSTTVTCPSANFRNDDVGRMVTGSGLTATSLYTISAVTDYQTITLNTSTGVATSTGRLVVHDARVVTDGVTNTNTTITSATANFTADDVGMKIRGSADIGLGNYIASVESPTSATLATAATGSGSGRTFAINTYRGGRIVEDLNTTQASATVTSATAAFTQNDVGRQVRGTAIPNNTTIVSVTNSTTAVLSNLAGQTYASLGYLEIGSQTPVDVAAIDVLWSDGIASNGTTFTYSVDGGQTWQGVTQVTSGGPLLRKTTITTTNPHKLIIRANTTAGALSQTCQCGILTYQVAPTQLVSGAPTKGFNLFSFARDGFTMNNLGAGGVGDGYRIFDNRYNGFTGLRPDLFIVMFSNDVTASNISAWRRDIMRFLQRVHRYADVLFIGCYEQAASRSALQQAQFRAVAKDIMLNTSKPIWTASDGATNSNTTVTSLDMNFGDTDIGLEIRGGSIPAGATIVSVQSDSSVTISSAATSTATDVELTVVGTAMNTRCAFLDLYEAYTIEGNKGYAEANDDGLMYDTLHQSALGHIDVGARISRILRVLS